MVLEEIVFVAAVALGALKTADEEHGHAYRDQHSKNASIHREPMRQVLHLQSPFLQGAPLTHNDCTCKIQCRATIGRKSCTKGNPEWLSRNCTADGKRIQLQLRE
jgi:hypothetical protein